jgi:hypothetical protein
MALFKSLKRNGKKAYGTKVDKKEVKYVYIASSRAIFLINGEVRESKYSFGVEIIPLYGKFRSTKEKKVYGAEELRGYTVVLNLPKNTNVGELKGKKLVVLGYSEDEVFVGLYEDERKEVDN